MEVRYCDELLGKDTFENYYEVVFVGCLSRDMRRTGVILDVSRMKYEADIIGNKQKLFFDCLEYEGCLITGIEREEGWTPSGLDPYPFDANVFSHYLDNIFEDCGDRYRWSDDWAKRQNYGEWDRQMYGASRLSLIFLYLVSAYIWEMLIGNVENKPIEFYIDGVLTKSAYQYLSIYALKKTLPFFDRMVKLTVVEGQEEGSNSDPEFTYFIMSGIEGGRNQKYDVSDKLRLLDRYDIKKGSIVTLYERVGINNTNKVGRVVPLAKLCRVDEITDTCIKLTTIPVYKTKKEVYDQYYSIPDDMKWRFAEMLDFKLKSRTLSIELYGLGIYNYMLDELQFITPLDTTGRGKHLVDGEIGVVDFLAGLHVAEVDDAKLGPVVEEGIKRLADVIHAVGAAVVVDGAALVCHAEEG